MFLLVNLLLPLGPSLMGSREAAVALAVVAERAAWLLNDVGLTTRYVPILADHVACLLGLLYASLDLFCCLFRDSLPQDIATEVSLPRTQAERLFPSVVEAASLSSTVAALGKADVLDIVGPIHHIARMAAADNLAVPVREAFLESVCVLCQQNAGLQEALILSLCPRKETTLGATFGDVVVKCIADLRQVFEASSESPSRAVRQLFAGDVPVAPAPVCDALVLRLLSAALWKNLEVKDIALGVMTDGPEQVPRKFSDLLRDAMDAAARFLSSDAVPTKMEQNLVARGDQTQINALESSPLFSMIALLQLLAVWTEDSVTTARFWVEDVTCLTALMTILETSANSDSRVLDGLPESTQTILHGSAAVLLAATLKALGAPSQNFSAKKLAADLASAIENKISLAGFLRATRLLMASLGSKNRDLARHLYHGETFELRGATLSSAAALAQSLADPGTTSERPSSLTSSCFSLHFITVASAVSADLESFLVRCFLDAERLSLREDTPSAATGAPGSSGAAVGTRHLRELLSVQDEELSRAKAALKNATAELEALKKKLVDLETESITDLLQQKNCLNEQVKHLKAQIAFNVECSTKDQELWAKQAQMFHNRMTALENRLAAVSKAYVHLEAQKFPPQTPPAPPAPADLLELLAVLADKFPDVATYFKSLGVTLPS